MKRYPYLFATAMLGLSLSGCMNPQGQPDYTASGALAGAATGAVIGSTARHSGAGSLVGAAVGAVAGGAIGHGMDQTQQVRNAQIAQAQQQTQPTQPLSLDDIKSLSRSKVSDDLIISQIRNSRTIYHLSTAHIIDLKRSGVSDRVIDFMINTPSMLQSATVTTAPATPPPAPLVEPMVVAPAPDYFWVSGAWIWLDGGWAWRHGYWHEPYRHGGFRHWR